MSISFLQQLCIFPTGLVLLIFAYLAPFSHLVQILPPSKYFLTIYPFWYSFFLPYLVNRSIKHWLGVWPSRIKTISQLPLQPDVAMWLSTDQWDVSEDIRCQLPGLFLKSHWLLPSSLHPGLDTKIGVLSAILDHEYDGHILNIVEGWNGRSLDSFVFFLEPNPN